MSAINHESLQHYQYTRDITPVTNKWIKPLVPEEREAELIHWGMTKVMDFVQTKFFKCIFLNEKLGFLLKNISKDPIDKE